MNLRPRTASGRAVRFSDDYNQQHKSRGITILLTFADTADTVITDSRCRIKRGKCQNTGSARRTDKCLKILRCVEGGSLSTIIPDDPASNDL